MSDIYERQIMNGEIREQTYSETWPKTWHVIACWGSYGFDTDRPDRTIIALRTPASPTTWAIEL